jgi:hypothetical protein
MNAQPAAVDDHKIIGGSDDLPKTADEQEATVAVNDYSKTSSDGKLMMEVKVSSPFRDYFDGKAFSISGENATGPFDILPRHHNFISLLGACELVLRSEDNGEQRIKISGGIMHVKADKVIVFLDV